MPASSRPYPFTVVYDPDAGSISPQGSRPRLAVKAVKDSPAHVYGGASLLVASR